MFQAGLVYESIPHWVRRYARIRPDYSFPSSMISDFKSGFLITLSFYNPTFRNFSLKFRTIHSFITGHILYNASLLSTSPTGGNLKEMDIFKCSIFSPGHNNTISIPDSPIKYQNPFGNWHIMELFGFLHSIFICVLSLMIYSKIHFLCGLVSFILSFHGFKNVSIGVCSEYINSVFNRVRSFLVLQSTELKNRLIYFSVPIAKVDLIFQILLRLSNK